MVCGGLRINKHGPVEKIFPDGFVFWKGERFLMDSGFKIYLKQWLSVKSHKMWQLLLFYPVRKKWMIWMSLKIVLRSRKTIFLCGLQGVNNQWGERHKRVNQKWLTCDLFQKWAEEHVKKRGEYPICCFLLPCTPNVWPRWCFFYYQIVLTFLTITLKARSAWTNVVEVQKFYKHLRTRNLNVSPQTALNGILKTWNFSLGSSHWISGVGSSTSRGIWRFL